MKTKNKIILGNTLVVLTVLIFTNFIFSIESGGEKVSIEAPVYAEETIGETSEVGIIEDSSSEKSSRVLDGEEVQSVEVVKDEESEGSLDRTNEEINIEEVVESSESLEKEFEQKENISQNEKEKNTEGSKENVKQTFIECEWSTGEIVDYVLSIANVKGKDVNIEVSEGDLYVVVALRSKTGDQAVTGMRNGFLFNKETWSID